MLPKLYKLNPQTNLNPQIHSNEAQTEKTLNSQLGSGAVKCVTCAHGCAQARAVQLFTHEFAVYVAVSNSCQLTVPVRRHVRDPETEFGSHKTPLPPAPNDWRGRSGGIGGGCG